MLHIGIHHRLPLHHHFHHRYILMALVERRELAGRELEVEVGDDDGAVLAVDESDMVVGVVGFNIDNELGNEG